jgi:NitT/TauT family transport system permease protein
MSSPGVVPLAGLSRPRRNAWLVLRPSPRGLLLIAVIGLVLLVWEAAITITKTNEIILPKPSSIWLALIDGFSAPVTSRASYFPHIRQTMSEVLAGYLIGTASGVALATLSVRFGLVEYLLRPFVVSLQSVPKIALAPLLIVWFGFGFNSKFVLVILATFFPLFVNGIAGFKSVEEGPLRMMRSFGATPWQVFTKVTFPTALPYIFAGLEIAMVHAITSAVAAEFLGGQLGLGVSIILMEQTLNVSGIFSVLMLLAAIGWLLNVLLGLIRRRVVYWAPVERTRAEAP